MFGCLTRFCRMVAVYIYSEEVVHSTKLKRLGTGTEELRWLVAVPDNTMLCETVSKTYLGETVSRISVWYPEDIFRRLPKEERYRRLEEKIACPWVWIGCDEIDYTRELSEYMVKGNRVIPLLLETVHKGKWSYVCSKTLEKKDFPVEGIQI